MQRKEKKVGKQGKELYVTPELIVHGSVERITANIAPGEADGFDGSGFDMK
jgi:hypothetical protein